MAGSSSENRLANPVVFFDITIGGQVSDEEEIKNMIF